MQPTAQAHVTIHGRKELERAFVAMSNATRGKILVRALHSGVNPIRNRAIQLVARKTGTLLRSLHAEAKVVEIGSNHAEIEFGTDVSYAFFIEYGTGLYGPKGKKIVPIRAKALHFVTSDGVEVFARSVKGMRPRPYMRPAFHEKKDEAMKEIGDAAWLLISSALPKL